MQLYKHHQYVLRRLTWQSNITPARHILQVVEYPNRESRRTSSSLDVQIIQQYNYQIKAEAKAGKVFSLSFWDVRC